MLKPVKTKYKCQDIQIACVHWKTFPPVDVVLGYNPEKIRAQGSISESTYQQIKVWERVCGLKAMLPAKCLSCPHVREVMVKDHQAGLATLGGVFSPIVDGLDARHFHNSHLVHISKHERGGGKV